MAHDNTKDKSFFSEIMDIAVDEILKAQKKPRTSTTTTTKKPRNSLQKENKNETKKTIEERKKPGRKPLGVVNEIKPGRKSTSSPTTSKIDPPKKKAQGRSSLSATQTKSEKVIPKIIVYEDPTDKTNKNRKSVRKLSKSWEGFVANVRKRYEKSPELGIAKTKNVRRSLNDLTMGTKKEKSSKNSESRKSPVKAPKLKPGQPEFELTMAKLETLFPNVDPEFIKIQFLKLKCSLADIIEFLTTKEKTNELPTRADYVRKLKMEKLQKKFLEDFSIVDFLKIIPDPWEYFLKSEKHNCRSYLGHSLHYLKNKYKKCYMKDIQEALAKNECSLYLADKHLKKKIKTMKLRATNRSNNECVAGRPTNFNMQFAQEVAFIENETKIRSHIKKETAARYKKFKEAEGAGTLLKCQSCNDFSLLQDDVVNCPANHVFCKDCVVKYVEIEMDKDNFQFKCLLKCEEKFSMASLQAVLSPLVMTKIIQRNQLEEIKAAGIEDLSYCPFCYYVIMMPPEIPVFKCLNPDCMMESCRLCKKLSHIPLKCDELDTFDDTVLIELEEQEQEEEEEELKEDKGALLKCNNCGGVFVKREDTNQMICPCGATICSICQQFSQQCQHSDTKNGNESPYRLSFSSSDDDDDDETEIADGDAARTNPDT